MNFKNLSISILILIIITGAIIVGFSSKASAPTAEIPILNSKPTNQSSINNQSSYDLSTATEADPNVKATSYLLVNLNTNQVISQNRITDSLPIASLTKLMTAWTVLQNGNLNDRYVIKSGDTESINPTLGLQIGDEVLVNDLVLSILIGSANDGAKALAGYLEQKLNVNGQQNILFTDLMNQEAKKLNLSSTRFTNSIGFDNVANYSSAADITTLVKKLDQTKIFDKTSRAKNYNFTSINQKQFSINATNKLIGSYSDLYAIKTGFTNEALGSMVTKIVRDSNQYLIIIIGSPDREANTIYLRSKI